MVIHMSLRCNYCRPESMCYRVQRAITHRGDNAKARNCNAQTPLLRYVVDLLRIVQQIY